jgi:hypothetical protein
MAIPEAQLETWAHQGAMVSSRDTYATVKGALERPNTPYSGRSYEVFLQGSYGNDTNIYAESDVDVVIRLDDTYFYDTSALNAVHSAAFTQNFVPATYTYDTFKADVTASLSARFGQSVSVGTKAVKIAAAGARRSSDVVVAAQFQRHFSGTLFPGHYIERGICFFTPGGQRIVNYPKQHSDNCTAKHQATNQWFKPTVRIFKNMRNRLIDNNVIARGLAPSYFIEGMLHNVPNDKFGGSYAGTVIGASNWLRSLDQQALNNLLCANRQQALLRDNLPTCWPYNSYDRFMSAVATLWNQWQ